MKKLVVFFVMLVFAVASAKAATKLVVSESFSKLLVEYRDSYRKGSYENRLFEVEGKKSNAYSSERRESSFFVVGSTNKDGGRILEMPPISLLPDPQGVVGNLSFTDVVTKEVSSPKLTAEDTREFPNIYTVGGPDDLVQEFFHYGDISFGSEVYHIVVAYQGDMRHPVVYITWGSGSWYLIEGDQTDDFATMTTVGTVKPSGGNISMEIVSIKNDKGTPKVPDGTYLLVYSPGVNYNLEISRDLKKWEYLELVHYGSLPEVGVEIYTVGTTSQYASIRAVELKK